MRLVVDKRFADDMRLVVDRHLVEADSNLDSDLADYRLDFDNYRHMLGQLESLALC